MTPYETRSIEPSATARGIEDGVLASMRMRMCRDVFSTFNGSIFRRCGRAAPLPPPHSSVVTPARHITQTRDPSRPWAEHQCRVNAEHAPHLGQSTLAQPGFRPGLLSGLFTINGETSDEHRPEKRCLLSRKVWGEKRDVEQQQQIGGCLSPTFCRSMACVYSLASGYVSATPPSIAIEALVLGGPESVRVVFHSQCL
jgi:hypothetical protein